MSHTKGPWRTEVWDYPGATPPRKELTILNDEIRIAVVDWDEHGDNPYTVPKDQAEANASLIAAAPELAEAVELLLIYLGDWNEDDHETCVKARAALKKARGG